jgi:hypothetical protein
MVPTRRSKPWIFIDCEARGASPINGTLTEFGAVHYDSRETFYGQLFEATPDPNNPAVSIVGKRLASNLEVAQEFLEWITKVNGNQRAVFVSDNPAYDWQWISAMFDKAGLENPFGHSARRISDYWAGLKRDWTDTQSWKRLRVTKHDHNPVNDAMGNVEAFEKMQKNIKEETR